MRFFDMRTVIFSYGISNLICMAVMVTLWKQNHQKYEGLSFWLANFIMQFIGIVLVALRGIVPDFLSMTVGNAMIIGGTVFLYIGIEQFIGKRGPQLHNYLLLATFIITYTYFVYILPSLTARNLLFSLALLAICSQGVWLMLRRATPDVQFITRNVGYVLIIFCLVSILRIVVDLIVPPGNDFFHSNTYDTFVLIAYQMLYILLSFSLFLMVNHRLFADLESDIATRRDTEEALRLSEEKFFKAFHASPDAIVISRASDGQFVDVNDGFSRLSGYSREDALSNSATAMGIWANPREREAVVATLEKDRRVYDFEIDFRTKPGKILHCLLAGELIQLNKEAHVLWVVRDITERKQAEKTAERGQKLLATMLDVLPVGVCLTDEAGHYRMMNDAYCAIYEYDREEMLGQHYSVIMPPDQVALANAHYARLLSGDTGIPTERKRQRKDGSIIYIEAANALVKDMDGQKMVITTVRDITERRQAEEIIRLRLGLLEYATTHPVNELMQKALDEIGELTGSPIGFYHFVDENQNSLSLQAWSTRTLAEFCQAEGKGMHYPIEQAGVWTDCVYQQKPVVHNDYSALSHRKGLPDGHAEVVRELVVPTMRDGRVVAILGVGNKSSIYNEQDVEFVSYIADLIWSIVEQKRADEQILELNAQLERLAMIDDLTGLMNRRSFFAQCEKEIRRTKRHQIPLSLLMLDIDGFKMVNDRYGHSSGDLVLQHISHILVENVREIDMVARLGGEEFSVLLPNTKAEDAIILAERVRAAVERGSCQIRNQIINVTVSIGVASYSKNTSDLETILRHADAFMYQAKDQGRNRVVFLTD